MRRVACFFARPAGVRCLKALLAQKESYQVAALLTHRYLPLSESADRAERAEFAEFSRLAEKGSIPLKTVDSRSDAAEVYGWLREKNFDFLLSCSWRYHVESDILAMAGTACINLHRGKLPEYRGAEPVRRALEDGKRSVVITGHVMIDEIDAGEILAEKEISVEIHPKESLPDAVERIKREITPYYSEAMFLSIEKSLERKKHHAR